MIGRLAGRVDYRAEDHVLIDVRGVGYLVYCSDRTLQALPGVGEHTALYTDLLVREDLLQLFGFTSLVEKEWHRLLMGVQGIGAKASLAILGALGVEGVSRAINLGDWNALKAAKGVGPKTAQRVVNELKDKAPQVMAMGAGAASAPLAAAPADMDEVIETPAATAPPPPRASQSAQAEALSALSNLGYAPGEAASAVAQAASDDPEAETPALIRSALKLLAPQG
ncbi:Holliday junction branch migration protein RuvA [Roseovarius sp. C7]|uniref:Holliday junction branch migration protein RuvA n=1 Tax=Roseovarius sp. C7 TaxID=3398643 RepID=UPI0039F66364